MHGCWGADGGRRGSTLLQLMGQQMNATSHISSQTIHGALRVVRPPVEPVDGTQGADEGGEDAGVAVETDGPRDVMGHERSQPENVQRLGDYVFSVRAKRARFARHVEWTQPIAWQGYSRLSTLLDPTHTCVPTHHPHLTYTLTHFNSTHARPLPHPRPTAPRSACLAASPVVVL